MPEQGKTHRPNGRKPLLEVDPELGERICANYKEGVCLKDAAEAEGIKEGSVYDWLKKAEVEGAKRCYVKFAKSLARARSQGVLARVQRINAAKDWKADAHMLALCDPEHYSQSQKHTHSGPGGKPIEVKTYAGSINLPEVVEDDDDPAT